MTIKDEGPLVVAVLWSLTAILFVVTALRCYTRIFMVRSFGIDDCTFLLSLLCFLLYTIFIHISAMHGFGQNVSDIHDDVAIMRATFYEAIGQTFSMFGMAITKWSLGLFLLRLVSTTWHRVAIWLTLIILMISSLLSIFAFWFQCSPPRALWDRTIPNYTCKLPTLPFYFLLRGTCIFTDLFFAFFPWLFIWNLQMNKREKVLILSSMSLGIIAAAFGIKCCFDIPKLASSNHLKMSVPIVIWAGAEQAVTMICIGIPVCRPLYKDYIHHFSSPDSKFKGTSGRGSYPLQNIGGRGDRMSKGKRLTRELGASLGMTGSKSSVRVYGPNDFSDEESLTEGGWKRSEETLPERGIQVTMEVEITRTKSGN